MKKLIYLDTETTGNLPDDVLCQLAFKTETETYCELFKPTKRIPPEASAVTHITNRMIENKPAFKDSQDYTRIKTLLEDKNSVLVAHNAIFDVGMVTKEGIVPANYICTLRLARYLDKENKIPQYRLQYLRYFLDIEIEAQAHDALGDVLVLEKLFERLIESIKKEVGDDMDKAIEKMIEISSLPSLMYQLNFGKYIGQKIADVVKIDPGYLDWLLAQKMQKESGEEDWIYTLKFHLKK